jgi:hypothetical protein
MPDRFRGSDVSEVLENSLGDEKLEPDEAAELLTFLREEIGQMYAAGQDSYVVLGSYEDGYIGNTSAVENELNKRMGSYAFLIADLPDLDIRDTLPAFRIKFHLICGNVDYIAGVYEDDVGGEIGELGKISEMYLEKTHILAREYPDGKDPYSAPTRDDLKVFDLNGRCYWWSSEEELRESVDEVP